MLQSIKDINLIVIHCSATRENQDYSFEQLKNDHRLRGFTSCGYHFYIRRDGTVFTGRTMSTVGAHVAGFNRNSVGICYEGGLDNSNIPKDTRTQIQKDILLATIKLVMSRVRKEGGKITKITGHRDLSPDKNKNGVVEPDEWIKSCPCFDAEPEYKHLV